MTTERWRGLEVACFYCASVLPGGALLAPAAQEVDHFIPQRLDGGGGPNLVPACRSCNRRKNRLTGFVWLRMCWLEYTIRNVHSLCRHDRAAALRHVRFGRWDALNSMLFVEGKNAFSLAVTQAQWDWLIAADPLEDLRHDPTAYIAAAVTTP